MELPGILASMGEGAITLAGFAAIFRAFAGGFDPDGLSRVRLNSVIEGGLTVALVCYLPAWLASAGLSESLVWAIPSGVVLLWGVARIAVPSLRILRAGAPLPELFFPVGVAGLVALTAGALNVTGLTPISEYSTHLLASLALLSNVGLIFIAQFRAEQNAGDAALSPDGPAA